MNTFSPPKVAAAIGALSLAFAMTLTPVLAENGPSLDVDVSNQQQPGNHISVAQNGPVNQSKIEVGPSKVEVEIQNKQTNIQNKIDDKMQQMQTRIASQEAQLKLRLENQQQEIKERLTDAKLKACQNRATAIANHLKNSTKAATNLEGKFAAIAQKAEQFKTDKNITVANYDQLTADVATQKTALDSAISTAQSDGTSFSCTSDGPKAQLQQFVSQMDAVRQALNNYRDAIRDLIQAIRQANGQNRQASDSATPSSTPSATPEGGKE